jgi:mRNA-degrading endonuclease RelE of RelBE toxin-antitoxin system
LSVLAEGRWQVELLPGATTGLTQILQDHGDDAFDQALNEILALEEDPTPQDAEHLRKTKGHYRIYLYRSLYRAVYRVLFGKRIVLVERIGPRGSVYLKGGFARW